MNDFFWLSDAQMAGQEPLFPKSYGKRSVDDQRVLSGISFINRDGLRWRGVLPPMTRTRRSRAAGSAGARKASSRE